MERIIRIGETEVKMKASAFTPFQFKAEFNGDIISGIQRIRELAKKGETDTEFISKVAYTMAKAANPDIEPLEAWLEQFGMVDFFAAMPDIVGLWSENEKATSKPKKK